METPSQALWTWQCEAIPHLSEDHEKFGDVARERGSTNAGPWWPPKTYRGRRVHQQTTNNLEVASWG